MRVVGVQKGDESFATTLRQKRFSQGQAWIRKRLTPDEPEALFRKRRLKPKIRGA